MLRSRYQLEMEMDSEHYVTAITTVADTKEGLQRLAEALGSDRFRAGTSAGKAGPAVCRVGK